MTPEQLSRLRRLYDERGPATENTDDEESFRWELQDAFPAIEGELRRLWAENAELRKALVERENDGD